MNNLNNITLHLVKYIALFFAIIVMIFSLSVFVGWYGHIDALIRYKADTIAVVFNSAVCFMMFGISIVSIIYNFYDLNKYLCFATITLSALVLIQYPLDINYGIDEIFFKHYDSVENKFPGRMAINTTVCFILSSIALLILGEGKKKPNILIAITISIFLLTMSAVFLSGYLSSVQHAYQWGNITPMSTAAAIGFINLSIALVAVSIRSSILNKIDLIMFIPISFVFCILVVTIMLTIEIGELNSINNYQSDIPIMVFIGGVVLALIVGTWSFLALVAITNVKKNKKTISLLEATLEATADGVSVIDLSGKLQGYNKKFINMFKLSDNISCDDGAVSIINIIAAQLVNAESYIYDNEKMLLTSDDSANKEINLKNGKIYEYIVKPQVLDGVIIGKVYSYRDISLQKMLEQQLLHNTMYDPLTGLPNRDLLLDLMNLANAESKENYTYVGVFIIDINRFSKVNDVFGRKKGDFVLKSISSVLTKVLSKKCILARVGGDQFVVICNIRKAELAVNIVNRIMSAFDAPFNACGKDVKISCCIGVSLYPKDAQDPDALLAKADAALIQAKKNGKNGFYFYTQDMNTYTLKHLALEVQLHKAIENNQFIIDYQPIFDLKSKMPIGFEALVRWKNLQGDIIPPLDFIPFAEENGMINQIGEVVLRSACQQLKAFKKNNLNKIFVAINLSVHQIENDMLIERFKNIFSQEKIDPSLLEFELTESVFIDNLQAVKDFIGELNKLQIKISIDDFGTGYSSFSYLKYFKASKIKIDRSFISGMAKNQEDHAIVSAMIAMAKSLKIDILAEGIETEQQLELLEKLGCVQGQGFYFSRPLSPEKCMEFIKPYNVE